MQLSDQSNADHYVWGGVCDGRHLLRSADLSVIQRVPPGASETRHFYTKARLFFYVLSGIATIHLADGEVTFGPMQGVHVEPGVVHRFRNKGATDVEFLVISSPPTAGDRTNLDSTA